ncbi:MAG: hypothetical protein ACK4SY_07015 [Pyrobaculum sp.]
MEVKVAALAVLIVAVLIGADYVAQMFQKMLPMAHTMSQIGRQTPNAGYLSDVVDAIFSILTNAMVLKILLVGSVIMYALRAQWV